MSVPNRNRTLFITGKTIKELEKNVNENQQGKYWEIHGEIAFINNEYIQTLIYIDWDGTFNKDE